MQFNVGKCKVMHYGKDNTGFKYNTCGQQVESVMLERDLGVYVSADLKVGSQCKEADCKATQILGLIRKSRDCHKEKDYVNCNFGHWKKGAVEPI